MKFLGVLHSLKAPSGRHRKGRYSNKYNEYSDCGIARVRLKPGHKTTIYREKGGAKGDRRFAL